MTYLLTNIDIMLLINEPNKEQWQLRSEKPTTMQILINIACTQERYPHQRALTNTTVKNVNITDDT